MADHAERTSFVENFGAALMNLCYAVRDGAPGEAHQHAVTAGECVQAAFPAHLQEAPTETTEEHQPPPGLREATAKLLAEISWHGDYRTNDDHRVLRDLRVGTLREVAAALNGEADGGEERPSTRSLFAGEQPFRVVLGEQNLMIQAWTRELLRGLHLSNPTAGNVVGQLNRLFALAAPPPASAAPPGDEELREAAEIVARAVPVSLPGCENYQLVRVGDVRRLRAALDRTGGEAPR